MSEMNESQGASAKRPNMQLNSSSLDIGIEHSLVFLLFPDARAYRGFISFGSIFLVLCVMTFVE
jgi:hypothetical protein